MHVVIAYALDFLSGIVSIDILFYIEMERILEQCIRIVHKQCVLLFSRVNERYVPVQCMDSCLKFLLKKQNNR